MLMVSGGLFTLPKILYAQDSFRTQSNFRRPSPPAVSESEKSELSSPVVPKSARPFMGWRNAAQAGPATFQYFQNLARVGRSKLHVARGTNAQTPVGARAFSSPNGSGPSALPGIYLRPSLPAGALPSAIATGDFNGDGNLDWVVANAGDNTLTLYLGNGDGTAQLPVIIPLAGQSPLAVAAGDLNGDHKLDLVVAESDSNTVGILYGNGDGTFQMEKQIAIPVPPLGVALADVNHDGYLDLLVGTQSDGVILNSFFGVMLNDGTGNFAPAVYAPNPTPVYVVEGRTFAFADANADGKLDVLVSGTNALGTTLQLFYGNGDGTFATGPQVWGSNGGPFPSDIGIAAFADLNGDGCPDIAVTLNFGWVDLFFNDCKGHFPQSPSHEYGMGDGAYALAVADLNGDGFPDIITGGLSFTFTSTEYSAGDTIAVRLNDGTGKFGPAQDFRGDPSPVGLVVAALKSGSLPYIVTANQGSNSVTIYANDGTGNFGPPIGGYDGLLEGTADSPTNEPSSDYIATDLNGDGKPDLAVIEYADGYSSNTDMVLGVILNQGNGSFSAPVRSPAFAYLSVTQDFVFGTFRKSSSLPDFLGLAILQSSTSVPQPQLVYMQNQGNGQFGAPQQLSLPVSGGVFAFGTLALGDFNKDGNLDFAVATAGGPASASFQLAVFLGNGDGTFKSTPYQVNFGPAGNTTLPLGMFVGDANGDGIPDIFVWAGIFGGLSGTDLYEFLGKGDGTFQAPIDVLPNLARMTMLDLNQDGRLDVINIDDNGPLGIYGNATPQVSVYLGKSDGTFASPITNSPYIGTLATLTGGGGTFPVGGPLAPFLGDFNGDGKIDIALYQTGNASPLPAYAQFLYGNGDGSFTPTNDIFEFKIPQTPSLAVYNLLGDNRAALVQTPSFTSSYQILASAAAVGFQVQFAETPIFTTADTFQIFLNVPSAAATTVSLAASDPNVQISPSVQIPAGQISVNVPFTLASGMAKNQWFSVTATAGTDSAIAYNYSTTGSAPDAFTLTIVGGTVPPNYATSPAPGQDAWWTVTLGSNGVGASTFTFSCAALPAGATCDTFSPSSTAVPAEGSSVSKLTIHTTTSLPPGQYSFSVSATDGFVTLTSTPTLNVGDFAFTASPTSVSTPGTANLLFNLDLTSLYGYNELATFTCTNLPNGMTCPSTSYGNFPIDLNNVADGTYTVTIVATGIGNSLTHSANVQIQVSSQPVVSLSQGSISFNQVLVGMATQTLTLNNTGNAALTLSGIAASTNSGGNGSFSQTNNCGTIVAASGSCTITISYNATAVGSTSGTVQIKDNAGNSPQQVGLSATAVDFSFQLAAGSQSSATISAGQSAVYNLLVQPNQLQGTVGLSCSGAPQYATCMWAPTDVALTGAAAQSVQVTVPTTAASGVVPLLGGRQKWWPVNGVLAWLALLLVWMTRRQARMNRVWKSASVVLLVVSVIATVASCGGGSVGSSPPGGGAIPGTPSGNYTIVVTGTYGGGTRTINLGLTVK